MEPESSAAWFETIEAVTLGRYLVRPAASTARPAPVLVGFHGYAENPERHLQEIGQVDGIGDWLVHGGGPRHDQQVAPERSDLWPRLPAGRAT